MNYTHHTFITGVYNQRVIFILDDDVPRGTTFLQEVMDNRNPIDPPLIINNPAVGGMACRIDSARDGSSTFVVWVKEFDGGPRAVCRLGHEVLHITIQMLSYLGHAPKLKPRHSEPICYLFDHLLRQCLESITMTTTTTKKTRRAR